LLDRYAHLLDRLRNSIHDRVRTLLGRLIGLWYRFGLLEGLGRSAHRLGRLLLQRRCLLLDGCCLFYSRSSLVLG
jgi:hypothetical protein